MLIIALTFAASSKLLYVSDLCISKGFIVAPSSKDSKNKDMQLGAIALIVRMLWVLDLDSFLRTVR